MSGQTRVSPQRVRKELGRLYHALDTGEDTARRQSWVSPKAYRYSARDEPLEYMADVFGAYLLNPNTVKELAPITARDLRKAWNTGPYSHILQLNGRAPLGMVGSPFRDRD